ncbi:MAG: diguanylate cyclase [Deltaproteobacteria bacterium]|jgi:diguanylate cyclase (GGDEF)-like protein|nr:diguanylate cyclase [Deltaproteobacteria bacterium]
MDIDKAKELILVVDDDQRVCEVLKELLGALQFPTASAPSGAEALKMLKDRPYTFLLADMKMPEMNGMELIRRSRENLPTVGVIAMTGYAEEFKYVDIINAGANDFVKKPIDIAELEAKIVRCISERDLKKELSRLSVTDSLTGLFNQRHFYMRLREEIVRSTRQKHPLALILIDLDNFKEYNDRHGHIAGDQALRHVGKSILRSIREGVDSGYRYGGDEFAIILIDSDILIAEEIGKRVRFAIKDSGELRASLGYAVYSEDMNLTDFVRLADTNLYKSKTEVKNGRAN